MADQYEAPDLLVFDHADYVGNVQREIDAGTKEVRTLAEAGQRRGKHDVSAGSQPVGDTSPGPAAMPGTVYKDEGLCVSGLHVVSAVMAGRPSTSSSLHAVKTWMRGSSPRMTKGRGRFHRLGVACGKAGNGPKPRVTARVSGIGPESPKSWAYDQQNDSAFNPCASRPSSSTS